LRGFIKHADACYRRGTYKRALAVYGSARYFALPNNSYINYKEGLCYYQFLQWDKAISSFQAVLEKYPDDIATNCNLALVYTLGDYPEKIMQWEKCGDLLYDSNEDFGSKWDFLDWITNYIISKEDYYPTASMCQYITKLQTSFKYND